MNPKRMYAEEKRLLRNLAKYKLVTEAELRQLMIDVGINRDHEQSMTIGALRADDLISDTPDSDGDYQVYLGNLHGRLKYHSTAILMKRWLHMAVFVPLVVLVPVGLMGVTRWFGILQDGGVQVYVVLGGVAWSVWIMHIVERLITDRRAFWGVHESDKVDFGDYKDLNLHPIDTRITYKK